jgi:hypothetical protein
MTHQLVLLSIVSSLILQSANSQEVYAQRGNILLSDTSGAVHQLTASGRDTLPVLCSHRILVAFIRLKGRDTTRSNELWTIKVDGYGAKRILAEVASNDPKQNLTDLGGLLFSLDCRKLYFNAEAWATSYAVHEIDLSNLKTRFVTDGGLHSIVPKGQYEGFLIVGKHRYFVGGGSYDWYWVVDPVSGNDVGPLGESTDYFYKMLNE